MRQTAKVTQLRKKSIQPSIGITWIGGASDLAISALYGQTRHQQQPERHNVSACEVQISDHRIEIEPHGATTPGMLIPIGTEHPFANSFWRGTGPLLINVAMRNELV